MDDLYLQLKDSGSGCNIGNHYAGSLGYADDTVLMAPSLKGLQAIVDVSVSYARKHDVIYNGSKGLGAVSLRKTVLPGMAIPMLKIRRPNGRLIFNMEIAIRR